MSPPRQGSRYAEREMALKNAFKTDFRWGGFNENQAADLATLAMVTLKGLGVDLDG